MYTEAELELKKLKIEDKSWTNGKSVDFGFLETVMEGAHRPGHFNGVNYHIAIRFCSVNQGNMPLMKRSHSRNKTNGFTQIFNTS